MVFQVSDMTCNHCVKRITTALSQLKGVEKVDIDLTSKEVRIQGTARSEDIVETIKKAGYTPDKI
jgi:copper chaperone CopZ